MLFQFNLKTALYLIFVFGAVLGVVKILTPKTRSYDEVGQITAGMTRSEVISKVGQPDLKNEQSREWGYRYFHSPFRCTHFIRFDEQGRVKVTIGEIENMPAGFPPGKHGRNSDEWLRPRVVR